MKWELVKEDAKNERRIYQVGEYQVLVYEAEYKHGGYEFRVMKPLDERFAPEISVMDYWDEDGKTMKVLYQIIGIQTTAYGALKPEQILEINRWNEKAIEVATAICERYPMCFK